MSTTSGAGPERVDAYANAILEIAKGEDLLERVTNELFHFARAVERSEELRQTITNQDIPPEKRQAIIEELVGLKSSPLTTSLVSFVVGVGRARELVKIIDKLVERSAAEQDREVAQIRSAMPLDDEQKERVGKALGSALGKQLDVRVVIDPSVIGGLVARVGDTVIDASVRNRLDQIRESL
ncbi:MAG: ATP synthase F1 subunit delta [Actinomycetota bacterium]|nr:ATP synthase F1 subunit delta [Actinomycetota bacterium]